MAGISAQTADWKKILLVCLVIFSGCNHSVRMLGGSSGFSSLLNFDGGAFIGGSLNSLNGARLGVGSTITHLSTSCHSSVSKACETAGRGLNLLFGTY